MRRQARFRGNDRPRPSAICRPIARNAEARSLQIVSLPRSRPPNRTYAQHCAPSIHACPGRTPSPQDAGVAGSIGRESPALLHPCSERRVCASRTFAWPSAPHRRRGYEGSGSVAGSGSQRVPAAPPSRKSCSDDRREVNSSVDAGAGVADSGETSEGAFTARSESELRECTSAAGTCSRSLL